MYKILGWLFVIIAVALVVNKQMGETHKSDIDYLFNKVTYEISILKKMPQDSIYYTSKFDQNLGMNMIDVETLAIALRKRLKLSYTVDEFKQNKNVGEAVDFLRIVMARKGFKSETKKESQPQKSNVPSDINSKSK